MSPTLTARRVVSDRSPRAVDSHVGGRIRLRRTLLGMSQERLGELLGLTFQQVQKYERGMNRVGASRLFDLSRILDVPVSFFFDDMSETTRAQQQGYPEIPHRPGMAESRAPFGDEMLARRETLELVRAYYRISDPAVRRRVYELMVSMSPPNQE